jgi:hypothetical protein
MVKGWGESRLGFRATTQQRRGLRKRRKVFRLVMTMCLPWALRWLGILPTSSEGTHCNCPRRPPGRVRMSRHRERSDRRIVNTQIAASWTPGSGTVNGHIGVVNAEIGRS